MNLETFNKALAADKSEVYFSTEWVDSASIRKSGMLGSKNKIIWESSPPVVDGSGGISISHSKAGGVILFSLSRKSVGVDLEEKARLTQKVIARVSTEEERGLAPDPIFLWPAKEASYKSLYPDNSDIIVPDLLVNNWTLSEKIWKFSCEHSKTSRKISGYLFDTQTLLFAATFLVSD